MRGGSSPGATVNPDSAVPPELAAAHRGECREMSRRKQSNPRQIKRSLGEVEDGGDKLAEDSNLADNDSAGSDMEGSEDGETQSSSSSEGAESKEGSESPKTEEAQEPEDGVQEAEEWNGPEDLELVVLEGESRVLARWALAKGLSWGPYKGNFQNMPCSPGPSETMLQASF